MTANRARRRDMVRLAAAEFRRSIQSLHITHPSVPLERCPETLCVKAAVLLRSIEDELGLVVPR